MYNEYKPYSYLEDWAYQVVMVGGFQKDQWRLTGRVYNSSYNHIKDTEVVHTSTPIKLDRENRIVTTITQSRYKLGRCKGNEEQQFKYIEEDVQRAEEQLKKEQENECLG